MHFRSKILPSTFVSVQYFSHSIRGIPYTDTIFIRTPLKCEYCPRSNSYIYYHNEDETYPIKQKHRISAIPTASYKSIVFRFSLCTLPSIRIGRSSSSAPHECSPVVSGKSSTVNCVTRISLRRRWKVFHLCMGKM